MRIQPQPQSFQLPLPGGLEVNEHIFSYLPATDGVRCTRISRGARAVIQNVEDSLARAWGVRQGEVTFQALHDLAQQCGFATWEQLEDAIAPIFETLADGFRVLNSSIALTKRTPEQIQAILALPALTKPWAEVCLKDFADEDGNVLINDVSLWVDPTPTDFDDYKNSFNKAYLLRWLLLCPSYDANSSYFCLPSYLICNLLKHKCFTLALEILLDPTIKLNEHQLNTCLKYAASIGEIENCKPIKPREEDVEICLKIVDYLIQRDANVKALDCLWKTPLHFVSKMGVLKMVKRLVEHDVNIEFLAWGVTPLWVAVTEGHYDVVQYLLECGADLEPKIGGKPLNIASITGHTKIAELLRTEESHRRQKLNAAVTQAADGPTTEVPTLHPQSVDADESQFPLSDSVEVNFTQWIYLALKAQAFTWMAYVVDWMGGLHDFLSCLFSNFRPFKETTRLV